MHAPGQATTSNKSTALAAGAVARNSSVTPLSSARTRAQGRPRGRTACATPITSRRSCRPRALRACAGKGLPCVAFRALLFARSRQATRPAGAANQCNGASSEQRCQRSRDKVHMGCERHFGPAPPCSCLGPAGPVTFALRRRWRWLRRSLGREIRHAAAHAVRTHVPAAARQLASLRRTQPSSAGAAVPAACSAGGRRFDPAGLIPRRVPPVSTTRRRAALAHVSVVQKALRSYAPRRHGSRPARCRGARARVTAC
jgi:hypothetical protein